LFVILPLGFQRRTTNHEARTTIHGTKLGLKPVGVFGVI
jgi:hypothetical protein